MTLDENKADRRVEVARSLSAGIGERKAIVKVESQFVGQCPERGQTS
jgi:hypothetical protein